MFGIEKYEIVTYFATLTGLDEDKASVFTLIVACFTSFIGYLIAFYILSNSFVVVYMFIDPASAKFSSKKQNKILLLGSCGSGKTSLIYSLKNESSSGLVETVTSLEANELDIKKRVFGHEDDDKMVKVVDFPGHGRLRSNLVNYLKEAKLIIFLIDSTDLGRSGNTLQDLCELLYEVFLQCVKLELVPELIISLNKIDISSALTNLDDVKELITKQLTLIKESKNTIEVEGEDEEEIVLGVKGKLLNIEKDTGLIVDWCKMSIKNGDMDQLKKLIGSSLS